MWVKPGHQVTPPPSPPTPTGETLAVFDRGQGKTIRVALDHYESHAFVSICAWQGQWPIKGKNVTIRMRELPELLQVLSQLDEDEPEVRPAGETSSDVLPNPRGGPTPPWVDEGQRSDPRDRQGRGADLRGSDPERPLFNNRGQRPEPTPMERRETFPTPTAGPEPFDELQGGTVR